MLADRPSIAAAPPSPIRSSLTSLGSIPEHSTDRRKQRLGFSGQQPIITNGKNRFARNRGARSNYKAQLIFRTGPRTPLPRERRGARLEKVENWLPMTDGCSSPEYLPVADLYRYLR